MGGGGPSPVASMASAVSVSTFVVGGKSADHGGAYVVVGNDHS